VLESKAETLSKRLMKRSVIVISNCMLRHGSVEDTTGKTFLFMQ